MYWMPAKASVVIIFYVVIEHVHVVSNDAALPLHAWCFMHTSGKSLAMTIIIIDNLDRSLQERIHDDQRQ
jgi:hypothetical protein